MANTDVNRSTKKPSKSATKVERKPVPADAEVDLKQNSSKKRKKVRNGAEEAKSCHQCKRIDRNLILECTKCQSKRYCVGCITKWYPDVSVEEFVKACPFCCNNCNCKACLRRFSVMQGYSCSELNIIKYSKQILQKVFLLVTKLNEDQLIEKAIEAKVKGVSISELQLQDADCDVDDDIFCDNCGSYSFDLFRSCACGYELCLECCRELRDGQLNGMTYGWKSHPDGSISCPPKDIGGCNGGTLELKRIMSVNWIVNLLEKAQRVYKRDNSDDIFLTCFESNASYVCSLNAKDVEPLHMQHFQFHWSKGEPIIVNDVLSTSSGLSWEPMVLWRAFRDITKSTNHSHACDVKVINCSDWCEVTVDLIKFCRGYSASQVNNQGLVLKLEDWQPSCLYQGELPRHYVEFLKCLPFKDYTHPHNGYLNVTVKLPDLSSKPDMGPKMDIAYEDSVTKLHYEKSDTVNVLTHTKSGVLTSTKVNKTKVVKQEHGDQHESLVCEAGPQRNDSMEGVALWDIFQRQDVPKLEEYLRNHSTEFSHTGYLSVEQVFHPIHDRTFYLNIEHKRKLKEEFGIEPWTFKQKLGDAVFVPAGCPYQVRNLKSNTKVELNFISPENLGECTRLQKELRMLPNNHRAKKQKLNIGKLMIYALDQTVSDVSRFIDSDGPTQDQFAKMPNIFNGGDGINNNHTNGWVSDSESDSISQNTRSVSRSVSPALSSVNHTVDHQPATIEDPDTYEEDEHTGLWQKNDIGQPGKEILQAVMHHYPKTFQGVKIRSKPYWLTILKELHVFIKDFLETPVDALSKDKITSLEADLNDFENFGFDLSWARKRLDMVKSLKFGNDPLRLELVEANERLEKARLDYDEAIYARNKKVDEVARKFGAEYEDVLNGNLGYRMLPGY